MPLSDPRLDLARLRAEQPALVGELLRDRRRRPLLSGDGRLFIVAADHPARGALGAGRRSSVMADRTELLERLVAALERPGVDGVPGTPDVVEDLAVLGALDGKVVVGSMNRGGLRGAAFEMDDRFTGYDVPAMVRDGIDFATLLIRVNLEDPGDRRHPRGDRARRLRRRRRAAADHARTLPQPLARRADRERPRHEGGDPVGRDRLRPRRQLRLLLAEAAGRRPDGRGPGGHDTADPAAPCPASGAWSPGAPCSTPRTTT